MYNIYTAAGLLWPDGLAQSPSEAVPFNLWEGSGVWYSLDGQSVALWEEVFQKSLCLLIVPWDGLSSSDLVGVSNRLFKAWNRAILDVCGSQSDSSELPLVTPLAFSDLALALLGGTLLKGGCSGVEVWEVLMWFDSEVAVRVSGVAETVDYFR